MSAPLLRVLVKVRTFVNGAVREVGEEITIAEHLFSTEVHDLLETLGIKKEPVPVVALPPTVPASPPAPQPPAADSPTPVQQDSPAASSEEHES